MFTRRITTALAALALVGALGACGGDDDGDDAGPASIEDPDDTSSDEGSGDGDDQESDEEDAMLEYTQCMRDNGVDMPDPERAEDGGMGLNLPDPESMGVTEDELRAAEDECRPILESIATDREPLSPEEMAERQDQAVALAECMRRKGHEDFADPIVDEGGGLQVQNPPGMGPGNPEFEQFEDDMRACEDEAGMERPDEGGSLNDAEEPST